MVVSFYVNVGTAAMAQCHQRQYRDDGDLPSAISTRTAILPIFLIRVFFLLLVGL